MASAILANRVDYVFATDPATYRKAVATPAMSTVTHYQSVSHATEINNKRKPFDDPRVRGAMHLALDRPALIDVVKDVAPMMVGDFLYPFAELAAPQQERDKWLGYQAAPAVSQTGSTSFLQHPAAPEPPFEVESLCGRAQSALSSAAGVST